MHVTSWRSLPEEIWFHIFTYLPSPSKTQLASSCSVLYRLYVTSIVKNEQQRAWLYFQRKEPIPERLIAMITTLQVPGQLTPPPESDRLFLKNEILRMQNLKKLILEAHPPAESCFFSALETRALTIECKGLEELFLPKAFILNHDLGKNLYEVALAKGKTKLAESLSFQYDLYAHLSLQGDWNIKIAPSSDHQAPAYTMKALLEVLPQTEKLKQLIDAYFHRLHQDAYIPIYVEFFQFLKESATRFDRSLTSHPDSLLSTIYLANSFSLLRKTAVYQECHDSLLTFCTHGNNSPEWRAVFEKDLYTIYQERVQLLHGLFIRLVISQTLYQDDTHRESGPLFNNIEIEYGAASASQEESSQLSYPGKPFPSPLLTHQKSLQRSSTLYTPPYSL